MSHVTSLTSEDGIEVPRQQSVENGVSDQEEEGGVGRGQVDLDTDSGREEESLRVL